MSKKKRELKTWVKCLLIIPIIILSLWLFISWIDLGFDVSPTATDWKHNLIIYIFQFLK